MSAANFNTSNQTLRQLLGNGLTYKVPRFQRDYSWTDDEWDDLWQDLAATIAGVEPVHYMGYLVLQSMDSKNFDVIDGQQRLATLSVMILAVLDALQKLIDSGFEVENNRKRIDQLRNTYIGFLDPVTLITQPKLHLNRNNDSFYQDYLIPLRDLPRRGLTTTNARLRSAFEWFSERIRASRDKYADGRSLAQLIDLASDRLLFTVITVTDELNAFKVFETLNSRGVRLSPTDLLKNYLFSIVDRGKPGGISDEINILERRWEALIERLGAESFPEFLRVHWNSRQPFVREADLFKTIRDATPGKEQVFELIRGMEDDLNVFVALSNHEDPLWTDEQRQSIYELRLFNVRKPWPFLLAAFRRFQDQEFAALLCACSVISFRNSVIGGVPSAEQERAYNSAALKISTGEVTTVSAALRELSRIYVSDKQFEAAFAEKDLRTTSSRNSRIARYILFQLEKQVSGAAYDSESRKYSLEHVLPENFELGWEAFSDQAAAESVYRLGNLALLEATPNRAIGNAGFEIKSPIYAQSPFLLTREIAEENVDWDPDRIAVRQRRLAKLAKTVWRISQLSGS